MKNSCEVKYEVNLTVKLEVVDSFRQWLLPHVHEMMQFAGFRKVDIYTVIEPAQSGCEQIIVLYTVDTMAQLNAYLQDNAEQMRKKTRDNFSNKFTVERRIFR